MCFKSQISDLTFDRLRNAKVKGYKLMGTCEVAQPSPGVQGSLAIDL